MKKTISVLLILVMCLSLCACGVSSGHNQEPTVDITGIWYWVGDKNQTLTFEDGKCNGNPYEFKQELGVVTVYNHVTQNYTLTENNGTYRLVTGGLIYVRESEFEAENALYVAEIQKAIDSEKENSKTLLTDTLNSAWNDIAGNASMLELGKQYAYSDNIFITFHEIVCAPREDNLGDFYLYASATIEYTSSDTLVLLTPAGESDIFSETGESLNYLTAVKHTVNIYAIPAPPQVFFAEPMYGSLTIDGNTTGEYYIVFGWGFAADILTAEGSIENMLNVGKLNLRQDGVLNDEEITQIVMDYYIENNIPRLYAIHDFKDGSFIIDMTAAFEDLQ